MQADRRSTLNWLAWFLKCSSLKNYFNNQPAENLSENYPVDRNPLGMNKLSLSRVSRMRATQREQQLFRNSSFHLRDYPTTRLLWRRQSIIWTLLWAFHSTLRETSLHWTSMARVSTHQLRLFQYKFRTQVHQGKVVEAERVNTVLKRPTQSGP